MSGLDIWRLVPATLSPAARLQHFSSQRSQAAKLLPLDIQDPPAHSELKLGRCRKSRAPQDRANVRTIADIAEQVHGAAQHAVRQRQLCLQQPPRDCLVHAQHRRRTLAVLPLCRRALRLRPTVNMSAGGGGGGGGGV